MKSLVHRLFIVLHLEEFQKRKERHLIAKIDHLKEQLQPLEQVCVCVCVEAVPLASECQESVTGASGHFV